MRSAALTFRTLAARCRQTFRAPCVSSGLYGAGKPSALAPAADLSAQLLVPHSQASLKLGLAADLGCADIRQPLACTAGRAPARGQADERSRPRVDQGAGGWTTLADAFSSTTFVAEEENAIRPC